MQRFYEAAGDGSWLLVPARACHTGFLDAGPLLNRVLDCLCCASCGRGMASRKVHSPVAMLDTLSTVTAGLCELSDDDLGKCTPSCFSQALRPGKQPWRSLRGCSLFRC